MTAVDQPDPAKFYDETLRLLVPSESNPHETYLVELDSYEGNGECACPAFNFPPRGMEFSKRELCARRVSPQEAIDRGLVKLPKSGRIGDALRCKHIVEARDKLASALIKTLVYAKKNPAQKRN